ncbi:hypothetical protein GA830_10310 [Mesorhizobium sp. NBSH29]|uniref:YqaJ viral recombinase family nuclease n=1 Tax=Mesorhizobium sp. NBSH29 TaxID=2654249 RepID=UPI001896755C|nr:YqaJ viral recombinase family protein [Mesorhizobium sp. NBSH29]QPC87088.1 hypothetical protein GA830_10310 [Mesorhizobium sp. NBSH29]
MSVTVIRPADRAAWLDARRQDVTASVAAAVLNVHPYTSQYQLWAEKTGRLSPDGEATDAMMRGVYIEPVGVAMLRDQKPEWAVEYHADNAYYRDEKIRIGATPDAFAVDPGREGRGNVQIKSASESAFKDYWIDPDTKQVIPPTWIALQAITEARLTGCDWACVALVVITWRGTLRLYVIDIPLIERHWVAIKTGVAEFWRVVDAGEHPPIDWEKDGSTVLDVYRDSYTDVRDLSDDAALDVIIRRYKEAKELESSGKKLADTLKPQIIFALGNSAAGKTASYDIRASTQIRASYVASESQSRVLRIKPRRDHDVDASRF